MKGTKVYYHIIKTEVEAIQFINTYKEDIKPTLPAAIKQMEEKTGTELRHFKDILTAELDKLSGTVNSTINYTKKHADDGQSQLAGNEALVSELNGIKADIKGNIDIILRMAERTKISSLFTSLAQGVIPPDANAVSIADTPSVSSLPDDSKS